MVYVVSMINKEKAMKRGDKVRTVYGKIETVMKVEGCQVWTYENLNGWYHPTKVWKVA